MYLEVILGLVSAFSSGLLAGEEFIVRYGVRGPVASLPDQQHIQLRQALIRALRIVVPIILAVTVLSTLAATIIIGQDGGFAFRVAGLVALGGFVAATFFGTVPINAAALDWEAGNPPANWRALVDRWESLNTVRCWTAVVAFAFMLIAGTLHFSGA